jgi:hypothetical protein
MVMHRNVSAGALNCVALTRTGVDLNATGFAQVGFESLGGWEASPASTNGSLLSEEL